MRSVVVMLVLVALAGCADNEPAEEVALEAQVGSLPGVVVDVAIRPLVGATVVAEPGGHEATTDEDGAFLFTGLEPGTYTLTATAPGHLQTTTIGSVLPDGQSPTVKMVLDPDPEDVAYVSAYQFQGYFECGVWPETCANVNIVAWIILGIGNVTNDRSLFLQWIDGVPDYLQTEMVWDSTQPLGDSLTFAIGGATEEQLSTGMATTYNYSVGTSPQLLTIQDPELAESSIGADRALLTQVRPGPAAEVPGGCAVYDPCGPGVQVMQPFETFTHAFYGFEPPAGWAFAEDGPIGPP